jgi:hypothetical protein
MSARRNKTPHDEIGYLVGRIQKLCAQLDSGPAGPEDEQGILQEVVLVARLLSVKLDKLSITESRRKTMVRWLKIALGYLIPRAILALATSKKEPDDEEDEGPLDDDNLSPG